MAIDISHLPSPEEIQKSPTSNNGVDISHLPSPDEITGKNQEDEPGSVEALIRGGLQGLSGGFSDEAVAGLNTLGAVGVKAISGELPQNKSALQTLVDTYHEKKAHEEQREKLARDAHEYLYRGANLAGNLLPIGAAFKGLAGAGLTTKLAAGAGLGALQGYGEASQDDKNTGNQILGGAASGAIGTGIGEAVVAPAMRAIQSKLYKMAANNTNAKQLAATTLNAAKGGNLYGEAGQEAIEDQTKQLASNTASDLIDSVKNETKKMGEAFKQGNNQRLTPGANDLSSISEAQKLIQDKFPNAFEDQFNQLNSGQMSPEAANAFRQRIKNMVSGLYEHPNTAIDPTLIDTAQKIKTGNLIPTLENLSKNAGTDIGQLNKNISVARDQIDPFRQVANEIVENPNEQFKWSSQDPIEKQQIGIRKLLQSTTEKAGRSTVLGSKGRNSLQTLQQVLETAKQNNPNLNINPSEIAKNLQNQSYLYAAKEGAQGIRSHQINTYDLKDILGAYRAAQFVSKFKSSRDLATALLDKDPLTTQHVSDQLLKNPKTAFLGDEYLKSIQTKDPAKLNNWIFQVMQNPEAKKALTPNSNEEEK